MTRVAHLDAFGGLAGDMLLGALLDLGVDRETLVANLRSLGLPGWDWTIEATHRRQLACVKVDFAVAEDVKHRHLPEILGYIDASNLSAHAKLKARQAFEALARSEAKAHGVSIEEVHFHEVGAADAILDICGVSAALDMLGVERIYCGPLPAGSGTVQCAHGEMPVPVPAVVNLLGAFELQFGRGRGEMVTPTGAALLATWGQALPESLSLRITRVGYGAGTRADSILRVALAELEAPNCSPNESRLQDEVWELRCQVDDISGEAIAFALQELFAAGAVDAFAAPILMKKGRPAHAVTALVHDGAKSAVLDAMFVHLGTLGVREMRSVRQILKREIIAVKTPWGVVSVKMAGGVARPEYEDCAALARAHGVTLDQVFEEARRAANK